MLSSESLNQLSPCPGMQHREARQPSLMRQVSLPDINVLADLWDEMPEDFLALDDPQKEGGLGGLPSQPSLGPRQTSLARYNAV